MENLAIKVAKRQDAERLLKIYVPYVTNTAVTFEYSVPTRQEFETRIENTLKKYPYLTAEKDGELVGYAYAGPFHQRAAYRWAAEVTIYVREDQTRAGIGRQLYEALEKVLFLQNILNVNACIAYPEQEDEYLTKNSAQFHAHLGYRFVGKFYKCGYKFGRWYHMVWMEKLLGEHRERPLEVRAFEEVRALAAERYGIL